MHHNSEQEASCVANFVLRPVTPPPLGHKIINKVASQCRIYLLITTHMQRKNTYVLIDRHTDSDRHAGITASVSDALAQLTAYFIESSRGGGVGFGDLSS